MERNYIIMRRYEEAPLSCSMPVHRIADITPENAYGKAISALIPVSTG
jgi:hypothetical protein